MPTYTPEFTALKTRLNDLARLIPISGSGGFVTLTGPQSDAMSAFVVLAHAACEEFMEIRSLQVATAAKVAFDGGGALKRVAKHLCIFPYLQINQTPDLAKFGKIVGSSGFGVMAKPSFVVANRSDLERLLHIGFNRFKNSVESNHGAGFKYQFKLLSCLGFDLGELGANFNSRISQLANYRGEAAHKKVVAASILYSPATLSTWPAVLIEGYRRMDLRLSSLSNRLN